MKIFSSFLSSFNVISKKKKSSRRWRHLFLRFYVDLKKKKGPLSEFCNFSPRFLRHTRARCREPRLSTVFGGKQKRRFLVGEKTTCGAKKPRTPQFKFNILLNEHFRYLICFLIILSVKIGEVEMNCYTKMAH